MERQRIWVSGVVQGVGFRPFVWRQAHRLHLAGEVNNVDNGVLIDIQGHRDSLTAFAVALHQELPPLARIDEFRQEPASVDLQLQAFRIVSSQGTAAGALRIPPDTAVCPQCLAELFNPLNRRWRHAFIGCTDCGPRYTLTYRAPYDRSNTSMAAFPMCAQCAAEYANPASRRFHAEPTACPQCGPRLQYLRLDGTSKANDPLIDAWAAIAQGKIIAIQGLGGFHLVCDARNPVAVATLRQRKRRPAKPFALLVLNAASARQWVTLSAADEALLGSPQRPILLLPAHARSLTELAGVAPGLGQLGLMLPATPIQYLLLHEAAGRPGAAEDWLARAQPQVLVATSANLSGEPLIIDPELAKAQLQGIADGMLFHDRAIVIRCDDSVAIARDRQPPLWLRRARGFVPQALPLPQAGPCVLALGAHLKNTFTLTQGKNAYVSQHIGDLTSPNACAALEEAVRHWLDFSRLVPAAIACDLQPDLYSTRLAQTLAARWQIPLLPIQHHHAHLAAVLAEHSHTGPALGLALDGFGWGDDGGAWGGELLQLSPDGHTTRLGHLTPLPLPGSDLAAKAPWRMAVALLHHLGLSSQQQPPGSDPQAVALLLRQIASGVNCPQTTSLGRWFDAIAGLAGICPQQSYEGEAAMKLEALAGPAEVDPDNWHMEGMNLDLTQLARELAKQTDPASLSSLWHATLACALADWLRHAMQRTGINTIALGGGCCANQVLMQGLVAALGNNGGCTVLQAQQLPTGDGAISFGQACVAIQQLAHQSLSAHDPVRTGNAP